MIKVLHCYSDSILSRIIRFACKSKYSHSAFKFDLYGVSFILEAQKKGVYPILYDDWVKKYKYKYDETVLDKYNQKDIKIKSIGYCGETKYDIYSLLIIFPIYLITGKWLGKKGSNAKYKMTCSEFVSTVLDLEDPWKISPDELYKKLGL